jgi:subtilisin-like proprotein convertase family protein
MNKGITRVRTRHALCVGLVSALALWLAPAAGAATFSSPTGAIAPPEDTSSIAVAGLNGTTTDVEVTLGGVAHQFSGEELDISLSSPDGRETVLMSEACQNAMTLTGQTFTFSDAGADPIVEGNCTSQDGEKVKPANYFDDLEDFVGVPVAMSTFDGGSPNGQWTVDVVDDTLNAFSGGFTSWSLSIETASPPTTSGANLTPGAKKKCKKKRRKHRSAESAKKKCKKRKKRR